MSNSSTSTGKRKLKGPLIALGIFIAFLWGIGILVGIVLVYLGIRGRSPAAPAKAPVSVPEKVGLPTFTLAFQPTLTFKPTQGFETPIPPTETVPIVEMTPTLGIGSLHMRPQDGMLMVYVPNAEFTMGSDSGNSNEKPPHPVALDDYWIDGFEVTNAMFQHFVDLTGYRTDAEKIGQSLVYQEGKNIPARDKWKMVGGANWKHPHGPSTDLTGLEDHPVVQASWNDSEAYCTWAGARLPTEAEWELAARGTDGRIYPWGNDYPWGTLVNLADINLDAIWANKGLNDGYEFTAPVGSFRAGASPYGALDMAGNASEWVWDLYNADYYSESPHSNPTGPESGGLRIIRGGQWSYTEDGIRSTARIVQPPAYSIDYSGFRCASSP